MPVSLTHTTVATGTDAGNAQIGKTQWNETHTLTMATSRLLGRTTAGTGAVEEITAGAGLTLSAGVLDVGSVSLTTGVTGTLPVGNGGTGLTSGTSGGIPYYSSLSTLASSGVLTANALMVGGGAGVAPSTITTGTGVVTALGVNTGTAGAFVVNGGALGTPSSGTVTNLTGTASININGTVGATTPNTGAFTSITATSASGIVSRAAATQDGVALIGRAGGTSGWEVILTPTTLTADRTITLPDANINFTTGLAVAQGGTGLTVGTSGGVPYFSSTSAMASSALLTANALMVGGGAGAAPSTITTGTGVVTALGVNTGTAGAFVVNGGALGTPSSGTVTNLTGTASININGTVGATTANTGAFTSITSTSASGILTRAAATQDGVALVGRAGGTGSFDVTLTPTTLTADRTITLPDANINFTTGLAVAQGGTGLTAGTSGGIPYFSSTSAMTSSALLTANALMVGGGAGAAPSTVTTGTGVVTALGVNTGTAGAFVVNGGALGTPSSGTVTNLTGTASININGTVGATTPNTGAFTSITSTSASGILTRAAANQDGVALIGRAGGTGAFDVALTPTTLTADRTITLPDANINFTTGLAVAQGGTGATTLTGIVKGNGTSAFTAATAGTDYAAPGSTTTYTVVQNFTASGITLKGSSTGTTTFASANASATNYTITFPASTGTVLTTAAAVTVAQGGTGATTLTGVLKGNGTSAFTAAVAGTDYVIPSGDVASVNGYKCYGGVGTANASGDLVVTFPAAFAATSTTGVAAASTSGNYCVITAISTTSVTIQAQSRSAGTGVASAAIRWVAVGL